MAKQDKQRLFTIVVIVIAAVILWLLLRGNVSNTVIQGNAGDVSFGNVTPIKIGDLPPLNYTPSDFNYIGGSKGCILCYSGYQRIETPGPPAPAPAPVPPQTIINYAAAPAISWNFSGGNVMAQPH